MEQKYIDIIHNIDVTSLQSYENAVLDCGLYPYQQWQLDEFPKEHHDRCGKGIGLWQYPAQFSKYIKFIYENIKNVSSYAEIGVAAGGTFMFTTEFLRRFCGLQKSYAVDLAPPGHVCYLDNTNSPFTGVLNTYLQNTPYTEFVQGNCDVLKNMLEQRKEEIDVLLIDGDHSYEGVKRDFDALCRYAKHIVFHDIVNEKCRGVVRMWAEAKQMSGYTAYEFIDQYASTHGSFLGIGVLVKN